MSYPRQVYTPVAAGESDDVLVKFIRLNNIDKCKELLLENQDSLYKKGWNQLTPLHHASLSGSVEVVRLFLDYGADPNAQNSFEETPLHYACRRGATDVVHVLLQNDADIKLRDKRGRSCMHFAAVGGSVLMMHYLHLYGKLSYDNTDDTGKNPLHICLEHRHVLGASYLLKNDRVDPSRADLRGVTPMHIAAEQGSGEIAWMLLKEGKCGLLRIKNQKGETPCTVAKQGKSHEHNKLASVLYHYSRQDPNSVPKGPLSWWYFFLLHPFLSMAVVFILAWCMNGYSSVFTLIMLVLLAIFIARQSHRMRHICRWPNPIFVGTFVGGIAHCTIAMYIKLHPVLWPCPGTVISTTIFATACLYLLWYLLSQDPGKDKSPKQCPTTGRPMTVLDIAERRCRDVEFCAFSELIHGDKTKYCRICESPMLEMDHHCLFLNNCVARKNHREFIILLLVVMCAQILFIVSVARYLNSVTRLTDLPGSLGDPFTPFIAYLFRLDPWLFALSTLCVLSLIWEGTLMYAQLSVIMRGSTTYFSMRGGGCPRKALSRREMLKNLATFFLRPRNAPVARSVESDPLLSV